MVGVESRVNVAGTTRASLDGTNAAAGAAPGPLDRLMAGGRALSQFRGDAGVHIVKAGETLSQIAKAAGTDWQTLARINGLPDPDRLSVGQRIELPDAPRVHVVRSGETLSGIARDAGVSLAALAQRNDIANPNMIHPGQRLSIAGSAAPSAGSSAGPVVAPAAAAAGAPTPAAAGATVAPGAASLRAADIAAARAAGHQSIGKCYAWVKTALQQAGAVPDYLPGVAAKDAGPTLEARGFVNLLNQPGNAIQSPYDAPKGAVLVYGAAPGAVDRNAKYGHIEIRTGTGFASDYASANARTGSAANGLEGRGRVLTGVYVKPDAAPAAAAAPTAAAPAADGAYAPGNLRLGANDRYRDAIVEAATRTGMTPQTVAAIIDAETLKDADGVWRDDAAAGTSSAVGMTQFLKGTWIGEATRPGGILNAEAKAAGVVDANNRVVDGPGLLALRTDARLSILAGADYARQNLSSLTRSGAFPADADPAALAKYAYVAHHEGLGGARGFLSGDMRYLRDATFEANVPAASRQRYLDAAGGSEPLAYRNWLSDYIDRRIDVTRFMNDSAGVTVPAMRSLLR
ncbi:LysM peptidoglycan-binding domain-containing protein [uncultured Sphingomonas sp.]|uniref:LysM peptidoglycan-binding domain-containing protein n=1 Tax=uncultured Sphingomonas sp. TaxID=158754 RepID=UPI0025899612|nr:LysM peptidoglycan-binding domain-containing protein [uncultured Sphingomonas sp.]